MPQPLQNKHIAVIGAGPMGLMSAYVLLKQGYRVSLFERDDRLGGMSASFDFDGLRIERFYHFICGTDEPLFQLLRELQIDHKLRWKTTKMGFFIHGQLYPWGDPISLLRFPELGLVSKIRYGLHVLYCKYLKDWTKLDRKEGTSWLKRCLGQKAYMILWDNLLRLKYYDLTDNLSAAWIAARIQRLAQSRTSFFTESLGYLEGGSDTLLNAMEAAIIKLGGSIHLKAAVDEIVTEAGLVKGLRVNGELLPFDQIISTIPLPYVPKLAPSLPQQTLQKITAIQNIGVICVLLKMKHAISHNFWMNINDPSIGVPGIIEYSNLYPLEQHVSYYPYYMPSYHPKYGNSDEQFVEEVLTFLKKVQPEFSRDWVISSHVARYGFAQTVCTPGFYEALPPMSGDIKGFFMADTSYYYPDDRSISESIKMGEKLARLAINAV